MRSFPHWVISDRSFKTVSLQEEGVAYRGRILVELTTKLDQKADKAVDGIHTDDILVVQVSGWFVWSPLYKCGQCSSCHLQGFLGVQN